MVSKSVKSTLKTERKVGNDSSPRVVFLRITRCGLLHHLSATIMDSLILLRDLIDAMHVGLQAAGGTVAMLHSDSATRL